MAEFLVFTLTAPMGAFGGPAGHERRGTRIWPGRSAILGLLGAALGIRRDNRQGQDSLNAWRMAVAVFRAEKTIRDFHTVQTVPSAKAKKTATRRAAIAAAGKNLNTIITQRDYVCDVCFAIALWANHPPQPLAELARALKMPAFTLYMGRKSCPLSAPLMPVIAEASDPVAALQNAVLPFWLHQAGKADKTRAPTPMLIAADPYEGLTPLRSETRWDNPVDRERWHFALRQVDFLGEGG